MNCIDSACRHHEQAYSAHGRGPCGHRAAGKAPLRHGVGFGNPYQIVGMVTSFLGMVISWDGHGDKLGHLEL